MTILNKNTNMKNKIFITAISLCGFFLTSCEDFLTDKPESVLTQVDFYTTPIRINQGVIGCYAGLANIQKDEWMYTELRSDNSCQSETGSSATIRIDQTDIASFRLSQVYLLCAITGIKFSRIFPILTQCYLL